MLHTLHHFAEVLKDDSFRNGTRAVPVIVQAVGGAVFFFEAVLAHYLQRALRQIRILRQRNRIPTIGFLLQPFNHLNRFYCLDNSLGMLRHSVVAQFLLLFAAVVLWTFCFLEFSGGFEEVLRALRLNLILVPLQQTLNLLISRPVLIRLQSVLAKVPRVLQIRVLEVVLGHAAGGWILGCIAVDLALFVKFLVTGALSVASSDLDPSEQPVYALFGLSDDLAG